MEENRVCIEFESRSQNEGFARVAVSAFVSQLDPTIEEIADVKTAVSEAVSNAVIHGYGGGSLEQSVVLSCEYDEGGTVKLIIEDGGAGISDIEQARRPLFTTGSPEERSGMGFTVMESFMDRVLVESEEGKGTRVTLIKTLDISYGA